MGSRRLQYWWILAISGLSWAPMILWQPMQRSTEGSPAYSERRASAWQCRHGIWNEPAWMRWLKKIGCAGAPSTLTTGRAISGWKDGRASDLRYAITWRAWSSLRWP